MTFSWQNQRHDNPWGSLVDAPNTVNIGTTATVGLGAVTARWSVDRTGVNENSATSGDARIGGFTTATSTSYQLIVEGLTIGHAYRFKLMLSKRNPGQALTVGYQVLSSADAAENITLFAGGSPVTSLTVTVPDGQAADANGALFTSHTSLAGTYDGGDYITITPTTTMLKFTKSSSATHGLIFTSIGFEDPTAGGGGSFHWLTTTGAG